MVTVCLTCGGSGFETALDKCCKCQESVMHRYCHKALPKDFTEPIIWYCENCELDIGNSGSQSFYKSSGQSEDVQSNKCLSKFENQSISSTKFESGIDDDSSEGSNESQRRVKDDNDRSSKRRRILILEEEDEEEEEAVEASDTDNDVKLRSGGSGLEDDELLENNTKHIKKLRRLMNDDEEEQYSETSRGSVNNTMRFNVLQQKLMDSFKDETMVQMRKSMCSKNSDDEAQCSEKCDKDKLLKKMQRFDNEELVDEPLETSGTSTDAQKSPNVSEQRVISGSKSKAKTGGKYYKGMRFKEKPGSKTFSNTNSSNNLQERVISEALDIEKPRKQRWSILEEDDDDEFSRVASKKALDIEKPIKKRRLMLEDDENEFSRVISDKDIEKPKRQRGMIIEEDDDNEFSRVILEKSHDIEKPRKQRRLILEEDDDNESSQLAVNNHKISKFVKEKVDIERVSSHSSDEPQYKDKCRDDMTIRKERQLFHDVKEDKSLKFKTSCHSHDSHKKSLSESESEKKNGLVLTQAYVADFVCSKVLDYKPDVMYDQSPKKRREKKLFHDEVANPSMSSRVIVNDNEPLTIASVRPYSMDSQHGDKYDHRYQHFGKRPEFSQQNSIHYSRDKNCREKQRSYDYNNRCLSNTRLRNDISSSRDQTNSFFRSDRSVHHEPQHINHRDIYQQHGDKRQMSRELEPPKISEQVFGYPLPMEDPVWKGILRISDRNANTINRIFSTAHLSTLANSKASDMARLFRKRIFLDMFTRSELWPECFGNSGPSPHHIALYFFPESRYKFFFDKLIDKMQRWDLAMTMRAEYEAELLIFTSSVLPMNFRKIGSKYFLWGVFRSK